MDVPFAVDADDVLAQPTARAPVRAAGRAQTPGRHGRAGRALGAAPQRRARAPGADAARRPAGAHARPRRAAGGRGTRGRSPPTRGPAAARRAPTPTSGRWLARAIPHAARGALRDLEKTGREIGRELAPRGAAVGRRRGAAGDAGRAGLPAAPGDARPGEVTFCLGNCPYRDAVRENQPAICTLHHGMTRGLLDVVAPQAELAGFVPRDPETAGCEIELTGVPEALKAAAGRLALRRARCGSRRR